MLFREFQIFRILKKCSNWLNRTIVMFKLKTFNKQVLTLYRAAFLLSVTTYPSSYIAFPLKGPITLPTSTSSVFRETVIYLFI